METPSILELTVASPRGLICHYNPTMVAAALVVSLLGAFTSTQLMSQARGARTIPGRLIWSILGSVTLGFCGTWCLHFLGMLSCDFGVPIGLEPIFTILSAVLAVTFTFGALSTDLLWKCWQRLRRRRGQLGKNAHDHHLGLDVEFRHSSEPLLEGEDGGPETYGTEALQADIRAAKRASQWKRGSHSKKKTSEQAMLSYPNGDQRDYTDASSNDIESQRTEGVRVDDNVNHRMPFPASRANLGEYDGPQSDSGALSTTSSESRLSLDNTQSRSRISSSGIDDLKDELIHGPTTAVAVNTFVFAYYALINGFILSNVIKGLVWSVALTNMHFMGVKALMIPGGYVELIPARVLSCAMISWSVCCVGVIFMAGMETNIKTQTLFTVVAATGIAAVHFSGMYACNFYSTERPSHLRGYPIALPVTIGSVAILTCMGSTGLLAHSATIARDKLAEVLYTRRRLWAAIAQKENAEAAAAARSEFIASASHEIRTPLHQLQGYADLLSKSELAEEDRNLLVAIQHATRSLTMITSNVLDWSRLEKGEAICRPVAVDIRLACEAIVHVLPNRDDFTVTELFVVVVPDVPPLVFIDETFLQRILMNLLSNSFKFTASGYVMLLVHVKDGILHIIVEDSGAGIPKSFLPQLFEPYKQVQAKGAERGTGLGMSITRRLLQRMHGSINVESKYQKDPGVGVANSGSRFILTIPITTQESTSVPSGSSLPSGEILRPVIAKKVAAILGHTDRSNSPAGLSKLPTQFSLPTPMHIVIIRSSCGRDIEGLTTAWTSYGAEVLQIETMADIVDEPQVIIWADLDFLRMNSHIQASVLNRHQNMILVPYKDRALLDETLGDTPRNIIPIRKPLIWHRILEALAVARQIKDAPILIREIKGPPKSSVTHASAAEGKKQALVGKKRMILLVEDNKINQILGAKMLRMLHYDVLLAEDGQEAINIVKEHAATIDAILMDQSMPRKDGVTATREIRELESTGLLEKRQTIIAVTAAAGPEAHALFADAGSDMFLGKPLSLTKLEQTLNHFFVE